MKNFIRYSMAAGAFLIAQSSQAACPSLESKKLGEVLCPGVGALSSWTKDTVVYERDVNVRGVFSNLCSAISKSTRSNEKDYNGVETNVTNGNLVCNYNLPAEWKEEAGIQEFSMSSTITTPVSTRTAACPQLTFGEFKSALCGTAFQIGKTEWSVLTKGTGDAVCKAVKGLLAFGKGLVSEGPQGHIYGHIGDGTTAFEHKCTYNYHKGSKPASLELHGKMSLELLRKANAAIEERAQIEEMNSRR